MKTPKIKLGAFFFGGVEMDDAGAGPPAPMDRRYTHEQCWKATLDYIDSAVEADRLGYDSFWTTEHHFQHEGYEVIPNGLQLSTWIAARTSNGPARHDVQRRAAVEPAAPRGGLRHAAQPVGRAGDPRCRPRHGSARGAAPQRQGRLDRVPRQPRSGGRRRAQPRGVRGVDGDRPAWRSTNELVLVPGQALPRSPSPGSPIAAPRCRSSR